MLHSSEYELRSFFLADTRQKADDIHRAIYLLILSFVPYCLISNSSTSSSDSSDLFRNFPQIRTHAILNNKSACRCLETRLRLYIDGTILAICHPVDCILPQLPNLVSASSAYEEQNILQLWAQYPSLLVKVRLWLTLYWCKLLSFCYGNHA